MGIQPKGGTPARKVENLPTITEALSGLTVAVPAGAAGTVKEVYLTYAPILNSTYTGLGSEGDTSLSFSSSTFTTEVTPKADGDLANGEYWVDYTSGRLRGKKADTGTSITSVSLTTLKLNTEISVSGGVNIDSGTMQAVGNDATGADTYATVLTPSADADHIHITLGGTTNAAIISLDGGTTDHIYVAANSVVALDWVAITSGTAIQAKNASAGNNYADLYISIW